MSYIKKLIAMVLTFAMTLSIDVYKRQAKLNDVENGDHPEVTLTYTGTGYDLSLIHI